MKTSILIKLLITSVILTAAFESFWRVSQTISETRLTERLCAQAGNALEIGAIRDIYETFSQGLKHSGIKESCVIVTDNGRSFAPDCARSEVSYHATVCRADFNTGVKAQILYAAEPVLTSSLLMRFGFIFSILVMVVASFGFLISKISDQFKTELEKALHLDIKSDNKSSLSKTVDWLLRKSGIMSQIRSQRGQFEDKIKNFEIKLREETFLRVKKEMDIDRSKAFSEKVKLIRHDLKSPLTALYSLEDVLQNDELASKTLRSAVRKIKILIEDLNDVETETAKPKFSILEEVIQESLFNLAGKIAGKNDIHFSYKFDQDNLSPVMVVRDTFQRVVNNLLDNALEAVGSAGTIQLRVKNDNSTCQLILEDDGCGIDPSVLPRLFQKGATFGKLNGLGLGLYSAKKVVEEWGGKIDIELLPRGTRFVISLPKVQSGVQFVGPSSVKEAYAIDDDRQVVEALQRVGIHVLESANTYADGVEILRKAKANGALSIVDYRLDGGLLGSDLIAEYGRKSACVMCTNDFDDVGFLREAKHLGLKVIPKPLLYMWRSSVAPVSATQRLDEGGRNHVGFDLQLK